MPALAITTALSGPTGTLTVMLDSATILGAPGAASAPLKPGQGYVVQWYVEAAPGDDYTVRITSPGEARINLKRRLKADGKDYGGFRFTA